MITFFKAVIIRNYIVLILHKPPLHQPPKITTASDTLDLAYLEPHLQWRYSLLRKGKYAAPKDGAQQKSIPQSAKAKPKKPPNNLSTEQHSMKTISSGGKPVVGRSPMEVEQALRNRTPTKYQLLAI